MTPYSKHKDETLVELSLLGNQTAYEELVGRYERSVLGTAYKITENTYSAQDASQDAFVSAWINLDRLKSREKFGAWVCSIAKNKARNLVVHYQNTIPDISLDVLKISSMIEDEEEPSTDIQALSNLMVDNEKAELHTAVEALSEKIREAIKLHYFEGLSVQEISQRLDISAGTVKWRLAEGRKQLRKEYGIMEKTYDDKESVLQRVMRQVERLKLWHIKEDSNEGFEAEYRNVLGAVEKLDESNEKQYALADVLKLGYWWCPGERNEEVFARMKEAALKSHNDEVMQTVAAKEHDKYSGKEKIDFIKKVQIPFMLENGFTKSAAYCYFWCGCCCRDEDNYDEAISSYNKVLELLTPQDVYYANALAAIDGETKMKKLSSTVKKCGLGARGEVYKYIDGKLYFWEQPGYSRGYHGEFNVSVFWNSSRLGQLIYDPDMKPGDVLTSGEGNTLTYKEKGVTVNTPAGKFKNCQVYVFEGDKYYLTYCETAFCPGVGIVWQKVTRFNETNVWELNEYSVTGKDELVPLCTGNKWSYTTKPAEGTIWEIENIFEVTFASSDSATVKSYNVVCLKGYDTDTWHGNMLSARVGYATQKDDGEHLVDVSAQMARAEQLANTKREKLHTKIASEVMNRIFDTDPEFNPNYSEKGRWNFFEFDTVKVNNGKVMLCDDWQYSFEWKDMGYCGNEGWKVLYTFLYDILADAVGFVWSDEWVVGYHEDRETEIWRDKCHLVFDVLEDEDVVTRAGKFENCRHISFTVTGRDGGYGYRMGKMDYWFAPGVGIVKFSRPYGKDNTLDCIWELTDYLGKGEGYFPVADGLFRRYEPTELGNGWHGSVEYTFDSDEKGTLIFRNSYGTQDRANYEADMAARNQK